MDLTDKKLIISIGIKDLIECLIRFYLAFQIIIGLQLIYSRNNNKNEMIVNFNKTNHLQIASFKKKNNFICTRHQILILVTTLFK